MRPPPCALLKEPHKIPRHRLPQRGMRDDIEAEVRYRQYDQRDDIGAGVVVFDPVVDDEAEEEEIGDQEAEQQGLGVHV